MIFFLSILVCYGYFALFFGPILVLFVLTLSGPELTRDKMVWQAEVYETKARRAMELKDNYNHSNYAMLASQIRADIPNVNWFNCEGYLKKHGIEN